MKLNDPVEQLNTLAEEAFKNQITIRTTEEALQFFKNPPKRAYSVPMEQAITAVVTMFEISDESRRCALNARLSKSVSYELLGYAANMAVLAVRTQSPKLIEQGLLALVIEDGSLDLRDSITVMAKLYHSAVKLNMNAQQTFAKSSSLATQAAGEGMPTFPVL